MKIRSDFVTNSSSSSYICEICGAEGSGWDIDLSDLEMVECVNGHIFCEAEMLPIPKKQMIQAILERGSEELEAEELEGMSDSDIFCEYINLDGIRYVMPEEGCPICQFIEYSAADLSGFLLKEYKVSRDEVFEQVKQINKRRKKLYEEEYITEVCKRFDLNPTELVAGWKERFGAYSDFKKYIVG